MIKIEKDFYKEDNFYNKDIYEKFEEDIMNYINEYKKEEYYKIIEKDKRTNIVQVFSEMNSNIVKWYDFDENKKILEIGANYGEVTQELVNKCKNVTSIEFSKNKIDCIEKRLEDSKNLKLILCSNLAEQKLNEKYDYIVIIGTAEYANKIGFKNIDDMLKWALKYLNKDGKILMAIDNKFGVKYLAGSIRNKEEVPFANYKPYITKDYKMYGKNELEQVLESNNVKYKFYYPVPNYKLVNLIYTDNYLPNKGEYNIYYKEDEEILFNELSFINEAVKNNSFQTFTNSYFIEISKEDLDKNNIYFVKYSNMRKEEYKIITKIEKEHVTKQARSEKSIKHLKNIQDNIELLKKIKLNICERPEENTIQSNYILKPTMDEYLAKLVKEDKIEEIYEELYKWEKFLKEKFSVQTNQEECTIFEKYDIKIDKENLTILKDGFFDLTFPNIFYDGTEEYIVFDQEWYEKNIPLEFILYRAIKQLFFKYNYLKEKINENDLYEKYNISNFIKEFDELEKKWQNTLIDYDILNFYNEKCSRIISIEDIKFKYTQQIGKLYKENEELKLENEELKKQLEKKNKWRFI